MYFTDMAWKSKPSKENQAPLKVSTRNHTATTKHAEAVENTREHDLAKRQHLEKKKQWEERKAWQVLADKVVPHCDDSAEMQALKGLFK